MSVFLHGAVASAAAPTGPIAADDPDHTPKLQRDGFDCPRCGRWAHQTWSPLQRTVPNAGWSSLEDQEDGEGQWRNVWQASICARCNAPSIWMGEQLVYPLAQVGAAPSTDMPEAIRELYSEAAMVAAVSPRAGAALARVTVERLIKHLDTEARPGDTLDKRIDRLRLRVSSDLRTMLHVVRITANDILHSEEPGALALMALDDTEGPQLLGLLLATANDLVDELITRQNTVQVLHQKLPARVQEKLLDGSAGTP